MYELFDLDTLRINSRLLDLVQDNWTVGYLGYYFYVYQISENQTLNDFLGYLGMFGCC